MAEEATTPYPTLVSPLPPGTTFGRIDQGVDYDAPSAVRSIGDGIVVKISPPGSWAGGTGEAVYIKLDDPVTINGHTYSQVYYAERHPLVKLGQRVAPGSPVMAAGSNELGFARNGQPACPLVGGLGAGTQPTLCGEDFNDLVRTLQGQPRPPQVVVGAGGEVSVPKIKGQMHAPGAWKVFTRALQHDLVGSLNTSRRVRQHLHRRIR